MDLKTVSDIEHIIKKSAIKAYRDNLLLTGNYTEFQSRMIESLVVITVAQNLLDWAFPNHYQIHLEYPIKDFYNGAFPNFIFSKREIFDPNKFLKRKNHNPVKVKGLGNNSKISKMNKSGRIDIAITTEPSSGKDGAIFINPKLKSLIGIEIKSINSNPVQIEYDFIRMANAISLEDPLSVNAIKFCYCLFYRRLDNPTNINNKVEIDNLKKEDENKWISVFDKLIKGIPNVKYIIEPVVISEGVIEDLIKYYPPEEFYADEVSEMTGVVVCYLIKLSLN